MKTPLPAWLKASLVSAARTTMAAMLALFAAKLLGLEEIYWAAITAVIIITQTDLVAALNISGQRLAGTAVGALAGAVLGTSFDSTWPAYGAGLFGLGLLCAALKLNRAGYRFAGITLTVIMLIPHTETVWVAALHRFIEVSVGLAVGVVVAAIWPEQAPGSVGSDSKGP